MTDYQGLKKYCISTKELMTLDQLIAHDNIKTTAVELGITERGVYKRLKTIKDRAASRGHSPDHDMERTVPEGYLVKGVSTYYDKEGKRAGQWVKSQIDQNHRLELLKQAIDSIVEGVDGQYTPQAQARSYSKNLLAVYPMGDPHIGLYAWAQETGEDWDVNKAESTLIAAMEKLVQLAPKSDTALIVNLGDFFHSDNLENRTRRSGNVLDVDTRWGRVLHVGLMAMVRIVELALKKHKTVHVRNAIGNHDEHSSLFISSFLSAWFRNEPRVIIHAEPTAYWYHQFGKVLIGVTHGDTSKPADLGEIMAADAEHLWEKGQHRYWYMGHIHHDTVKETRVCKVESFRTLAASDAWHKAAGYRSGRDMKLIVHHKTHGESVRHTVGIGRIG